MYHHPVPHIDATVGDSRGVIGSLEENKVAGAGGAGAGADVVKPLGPQPPHVPAGMIDYPRNKAGAVKGRGRGAPAPYIGITEVFLGLGEHRRECFIVQIFPRHFVALRRAGVFPHIGRAGKEVGAVPQRSHVEGIPGNLVLPHDVDREMGKVEVIQRHSADVVIVIHPVAVGVGIAVLVRPCIRFDVVPPLLYHVLCQ